MNPVELLFLGDSLIDYGEWPSRFPRYCVSSKGIPGETSRELLVRLERSVTGCLPDAIILMTGTNDLFIGERSTAAQVQKIIDRLTDRFEKACIILTGLPPFAWPEIREAARTLNRCFRSIADRPRCTFLDLDQPFSGANRPLFSVDGVHLNEAGYEIWQHELSLTLDALQLSPPDLS